MDPGLHKGVPEGARRRHSKYRQKKNKVVSQFDAFPVCGAHNFMRLLGLTFGGRLYTYTQLFNTICVQTIVRASCI